MLQKISQSDIGFKEWHIKTTDEENHRQHWVGSNLPDQPLTALKLKLAEH
jgi:hypothetical protein